MSGVESETFACVRTGERVVSVARADPRMAFRTTMCQTPMVMLCALPPFWWALPCLCPIICSEAQDASKRARNAAIVLTDKAIYVDGDRSSLLQRIPLDELGNITMAEQDTCLCSSNDETRMLQLFTKGNATPVYHLPCVVDAQRFIREVLDAQAAFMRSGGDSSTAQQPHMGQQHLHQQQQQQQQQAPHGLYPPSLPAYPPSTPHQAQGQGMAASASSSSSAAMAPQHASAPPMQAPSSSSQPPSYDSATGADSSSKVTSTTSGRTRVFVAMQHNPNHAAIVLIDSSDTWHSFRARIAQKLHLKTSPESVRVFLNGFEVSDLDEVSHDDRLSVTA